MTDLERERNDAVAVVVDRNFGNQLRELAKRLPVWIGTSELNRPLVQTIWAENKTRPSAYGVTIINANPEYNAEDLLLMQLDTISLHHPDWLAMEV